MKTIEEKAYSHVDKIFSEIIDKYQSAPWNEFRDALAAIYLAGATETLAGQWRSVEDELPPYDETVLVRVDRSKLNSKQRRMCHEYRFTFRESDYYVVKDKNDFVVGASLRVTHWMRLPELPKDETK